MSHLSHVLLSEELELHMNWYKNGSIIVSNKPNTSINFTLWFKYFSLFSSSFKTYPHLEALWQSPTMSSSTFCRTLQRNNFYCKNKIASLLPTKIAKKAKGTVVQHILVLPMVDHELCIAETENTATMRWYNCQVTFEAAQTFGKTQ